MFKAVPFSVDAHYAIAKRWWKEHGWPFAVETWELSPTGIVIEYDGVPITMAWLYKTDGSAAWLHWFISNRYAEKSVRDAAINHLIETSRMMAKGWGFRQLWTTVKLKRLTGRLVGKGFRKADDGMTNMVMEL